MGGINSQLKLHSQFDIDFGAKSERLHDEVFETFFAGNTKELYQPLWLVSVHYTNKALIKIYRG